MQFTGLSKAQLERRIRQHLDTGRVVDLRAGNSGRPFERVYTRGDAVLPAEADIEHGQVSGLAMACVFERLWTVFRDNHYERLASISQSHIYNLRGSATYRPKRTVLSRRRSASAGRHPGEPHGAGSGGPARALPFVAGGFHADKGRE